MISVSHLDLPLDMLAGLHEQIRAERKKLPGTHLSMASKVWSSMKDMETWGGVAALTVRRIGHRLREHAGGGLRTESWVNVFEPGGTIGWHDHRLADVSALLYLSNGGSPTQFDYDLAVYPKVGQLLIFGATDRHRVEETPVPRVSIAVNGYRA